LSSVEKLAHKLHPRRRTLETQAAQVMEQTSVGLQQMRGVDGYVIEQMVEPSMDAGEPSVAS
jgi:hypothetical protein